MVFEQDLSRPGLVQVHGKAQSPLFRAANSVTVLGGSSKIREVMDQVRRVAQTSSSVLILGESGTGKELIARAIHDGSARRDCPFVPVNCSALPEHLLESEFFGHKRGAFTGADENRLGLFEEADGGTLFLDEIGDMPVFLQSKLLRVLQDKKIRPVGDNSLRAVNVRIVAATHQNLGDLIQKRLFRTDLYYRLAVVTLTLPPLRERPEDIREIAEAFVQRYCQEQGIPLKVIRARALEKMTHLPWYGNVRELQNTLERAVIFSTTRSIEENDIEAPRTRGTVAHSGVDSTGGASELFQELPTLRDLEKAYIEHVLQVSGHAKEKTARVLGMDRKTLYRKILEFGIRERESG